MVKLHVQPECSQVVIENRRSKIKKKKQPECSLKEPISKCLQDSETTLSPSFKKLRNLLKVLPDNWRLQGTVVQTIADRISIQ